MKKIAYLGIMAAFTMSAFFVGKTTVEPEIMTETVTEIVEKEVIPEGYIDVNDIKGWETWEDDQKVYLLIEGYIISKKPYTLDTTVIPE